jgi:hypothetical protein
MKTKRARSKKTDSRLPQGLHPTYLGQVCHLRKIFLGENEGDQRRMFLEKHEQENNQQQSKCNKRAISPQITPLL